MNALRAYITLLAHLLAMSTVVTVVVAFIDTLWSILINK